MADKKQQKPPDYGLRPDDCLKMVSIKEIHKCQKQLMSAFRDVGEYNRMTSSGLQAQKLGLWGSCIEENKRYDNRFGILDISDGKSYQNPITCVISVPFKKDGRTKGRFLKDDNGRYYYAYAEYSRDKGIPKFINDSMKWPKVQICEESKSAFIITNLDDNNIVSNLALFVRTMQEMKNKYKTSSLKPSPTNRSGPSGGSEYTIDNIVEDGCFIERDELEKMKKQLSHKQNLILQGPPGTGKTWLAKKLAFALIGSEDEGHLLHIQFHSNWSYADFVRGYRPNHEGKLEPVDGPFFEFAKKAKKAENGKYVCVIEEINRGNLSSIFGEFLTLLEKDKRGIALPSTTHSSADDSKEKIFLPKNLYVIGTMNLVDKSLATIDVALRRRFAFANLKPAFNDAWKKHCRGKGIEDDNFLNDLAKRIGELNDKIRKDPDLGDQYCIGHSFFTPHEAVPNPLDWYKDIVEFEAEPLLDEYLFDRVRGTDTDKIDLEYAKNLLKI